LAFALGALVVLVAGGGGAYLLTRPASTPPAHRFTDPGNPFSVAFPVTPIATSSTTSVAGIEITVTEWEAQVSASDTYVAGYVAYPASVNTSNSSASLAGAVEGAVTAADGTLVSQSVGTYQGFPSVDFLLTTHGDYVEYWIVLDDNSAFEVGMSSTQNPPPGFTSFANSLLIIAP
jgi:hypothetical protein